MRSFQKYKKKKIILFAPSIGDGGVEKNLGIISNYLKDKIDVSILSSNNDKKKLFNNKINFICPKTKFFNNKKTLIKSLYSLWLAITKIKNTNLIIAFESNIFAIIVAKILNLKVIIRSNTIPIGYMNNIFKKLEFEFFFKLADGVIVNSYEFKKKIDKDLNIKSIVILNPIEHKKTINFKANLKIKDSFFTKEKAKLKLISIGRLTKQKDFLTLLKSLNIIKNKINMKVAIVGKGSEKINLQNYINSNSLSSIVKLTGYKKNVYPFIKWSDVFILSSKYEGLPNVLLEALSLNKLVISSKCSTGPKEILMNGKAGILFNVGDYKKLSKIILNFSKKKFLKPKSHFIDKSLKKYDLKLNCKKYLNLIERFI